jgi:hypothetical protein
MTIQGAPCENLHCDNEQDIHTSPENYEESDYRSTIIGSYTSK